VTIVCPDAELADGLATAIFVLGEKEGLHLINQLKGIECLIVNDKNELIASDSLALNFYQQHH
jgi:thiamine biosynthesis lipoprotein